MDRDFIIYDNLGNGKASYSNDDKRNWHMQMETIYLNDFAKEMNYYISKMDYVKTRK